MSSLNNLEQNRKVLVQAFRFQNQQGYDQALELLHEAGNNLIDMIENIQSHSQFYMRNMPNMKQQRQLVSEKDYREFLSKNERVLSRNFQNNAYMALLTQELNDKNQADQPKKWTAREQQIINHSVQQGQMFEEVAKKIPKRSIQDVRNKYHITKKQYQKKQKNKEKQQLKEQRQNQEQKNNMEIEES